MEHEKVKQCSPLLRDIIPQINKARIVDAASEFMILYNVIEKIRNYCMKNSVNGKAKLEIREEYKFSKGKNPTNKFIIDKIKEIVEIVTEEDKERFRSKANEKVSFIKKLGLIDQFNSLVTYLELQPDTYQINFEELIKARNKLYHGNIPDVNINDYSSKMKNLITDIFIKLLT